MRKPVTRCLAVVALLCLGMTTQADAGLRHSRLAAAKSCDCAPSCQPDCCRPTIVKPCCPNVYTYQRQRSCLKPPCCDLGHGPRRACKPRHGRGYCSQGCCDTGACCDAGAGTCCSEGNCVDGCCCNGPNCAAVRLNNMANSMACLTDGCCPGGAGATISCDNCNPCYLSPAECCRLAHLIYESQTACFPKDRRSAVRKISNKYDCECTPEVMAALIYALNDADPHVRATAAAEINDQLRKGCCCSPELTEALTCALGDCHKKVARSAEKALVRCGYDVVEPCCDADACDGCDRRGHGLRGRLRNLLRGHGGCDDVCCDDSLCCDGGLCGHKCGLGCRLRGLFKNHCGVDCCDGAGCCDTGCCDGGLCGHKCGLLSGLFNKHHGDGCCDTGCCDGGICGDGLCGHKCGLLGGLFNKHHGSGCCDTGCCDGGICGDGLCGHKGGLLCGLFDRHHGNGCCDTDCCDGGICGRGICGHKGFGSRLKGIFAKHHCGDRCDDCCDACGDVGCDGCCTKKGLCGGLRGLFNRHHRDVCCDGCCPTDCCTTGAQPYTPAPQSGPTEAAPQPAPADADAPAPVPAAAPAPPAEPQACRPVPRTNLVGHFGQAN
jgi:hypothetical protein